MIVRSKIIFLVAISNLLSSNIEAQGSWNIRYHPIDSVNESFIGKEIRIDFKAQASDQIGDRKINIRRMLGRRDTVSLTIDRVHRRFLENWKIYVDHGSLVEQTLNSVDKGEKMIIREMLILAVNNSSITLLASIYSDGETKKGVNKEISIDKAMVLGVLTSP